MNGIRAVDEDTQRVLSSLNTKEAELVFEAGGGGRYLDWMALLRLGSGREGATQMGAWATWLV